MIKDIAHRLFNEDKTLRKYNEKNRSYLAYTLAREINEGSLKESDVPKRIKTIELPKFNVSDEVCDESKSINQQIKMLFNEGKNPRQITKLTGKTYTRVKNVIKKIKQSE